MSIGSTVVAPELLDAVERALPHVKVSESYGLTEGGSPFRLPIDGRPVPRGSVGVLAPEVEIKLIDAQGNEVADEGELLIRCPYVCLGYFNEPEITRQKLNDGWLRTGDILYKDKDGFFYFRSRADDMFSCGGENVYPKEVENLLFKHPDVANAVVAPVPHPVKGFVPAAMVIPREGSPITAAELKAYCLEKGPAFSHPRHIEIVGALPLNGAGKIDRGAVQVKLEPPMRRTPLPYPPPQELPNYGDSLPNSLIGLAYAHAGAFPGAFSDASSLESLRLQQNADHSITSSARSRNSRLIVSPSVCAALRLTTSSNLLGCSIANSAGLMPLRILST